MNFCSMEVINIIELSIFACPRYLPIVKEAEMKYAKAFKESKVA